MKKKFILFIVFSLFILYGCEAEKTNNNNSIVIQKFAFNTIIDIKINDHGSKALEQSIVNLIEELESKMSRYLDSSEVSLINSKAGKEAVTVSQATYDLIEQALFYSELTDGAFDISIGPIIDLWKIGSEEENVPAQQLIDENLPLVNYKNVLLNESQVFLTEDDMSIDLGGVVKGYAADEIVKILEINEVESALINLGGNIYLYGNKADGSKWNIGIRNPAEGREDYMGTLELMDKTVVTSGPYEKYFIENGVKYHHIFNTKTGYPTDNKIQSVTIIGESSMVSDLLTTSLFVLDIDKGLEIIENLLGYECVIITTSMDVIISSGLKDEFKIISNEFNLLE